MSNLAHNIEEEELTETAMTLYERVTCLTITDQTSYAAAAEVGKQLKDLEKKIIDYFEPLRITAKASYDAILEKKRVELSPVTEAMNSLRTIMNTFVREQERIRLEEERKARIAAEEDAKKEREKLLAQAVKAEEAGKTEKAESLMEKAEDVYVAPVAVAPTIAKTVAVASGNVTQAKEVHVTVVDMLAFVKELCDKNPGAVLSILKVGDGPLKAFIKSNSIEKYAGLRIERTVGVRF